MFIIQIRLLNVFVSMIINAKRVKAKAMNIGVYIMGVQNGLVGWG